MHENELARHQEQLLKRWYAARESHKNDWATVVLALRVASERRRMTYGFEHKELPPHRAPNSIEHRTLRRIRYGSAFLFSFIMIAGGIADLIPVSSNVAIFIHLGYPLYVLTMIGVAKLLGALAILYGKPLALKEWAYAGFACDLVGALVSHIVMGDRQQLVFPAVLLILMVVSYLTWKRSMRSAIGIDGLER